MGDLEKHISENQIAAYIDWLRGEGPSPEQTVRDHVSGCDSCKQEILELAGLLDELDQKPKDKKPGPSIILVIRWAAALIGVMLVAMLIQFLRPEPEKPVYSKQQQDTANQLQSNDSTDVDSLFESPDNHEAIEVVQLDTLLFAENFVPDAGLELLVNSQFRAGNAASTNPIVKPLKIGSVLQLDFLSELEGVLKFTLLNNKGEELAVLSNEYWESGIPLDFDPGLYYWKVTDNEGILQVGRFKLLNHPD